MSRVAVFVDAGYLFAQGSTALTGSTKQRIHLKLNETAIIHELTTLASSKAENCPLLRIYWYDGSYNHRLSLEHERLAHMDFIKLRLGVISGHGQQKGVDSLIVTDLIDLARNHAITDALLLTGDEDVRIGVQIAQSFGVRIHLLGIDPSRGSQSRPLMREADTTTEWSKDTVANFLSVKAPLLTDTSVPPVVKVGGTDTSKSRGEKPEKYAELEASAATLMATLDSDEVREVKEFSKNGRGVPPEYDGRLLARTRDAIGRDLDRGEARYIRAHFLSLINTA